jgi:hypothetical protein
MPAPPAVPALPDTERRVGYTLSSSTGPMPVTFGLYGDGSDVDNWIQLWVNGVPKLSTDVTFGWALTSPTGPLGTIPRPITDGTISFNGAQTATVQIVGTQRPRRLTEFTEGTGVPARDFNQMANTIFAELREAWDNETIVKGTTFANLPPALIGRQAFITDGATSGCADGTCTTFGTNVTAGGGSLMLLIWYNGTNWTLIGK